jgi:hypothetical protein
MRNNTIHQEQVRGSSSLQEREQGVDDSSKSPVESRYHQAYEPPPAAASPGLRYVVGGTGSIPEHAEVTKDEALREKAVAPGHERGTRLDDQRWQDDGGESGEVL